MTKSTASAEPAGLHSSPSAYYLWEFPEKPVSVRLSLDVVDRLERDVLESFRAITARGSEVGGLLLGRAESGGSFKTVIENYELFHCDYSRGPLYLLSDEEKARMEDVIRRKKSIPGQAGAVVGFFRSNTRKELALDEEDLEMFGKYFSRPEQVFLLVKPFAAKASSAGLFIWEGGRVRGEGSYIEFPFRRSELGKGDFAKSIVLDAPKPKDSPAEPASMAGTYKTGSRAQVLPFSLKRDEEPPIPAPPLKREERAPVVPFSSKSQEAETPASAPAARKSVETPATPVPATSKPAPALPPLREGRKQDRKLEAPEPAPAAPAPSEPPAKTEKRQEKAKAEEPTPAAAPVISGPLPTRSVFGGKKLWALFGGLGMLALAGGTLYYLKSGSSAPSTVALNATGFQLKAEPSNGQLRVSWNSDAKPIKSAQNAVLSISDGSKTEDIPLDLTQLHAGSIMYSPLSGDVAFRLEVKDAKSGASRSEYIRVPLSSMPDVRSGNANDAAKAAPPASPAQLQPPPQQPAPANTAARTEIPGQPNVDATQTAPPQTAPAQPPAKPFSLASRVRQPDASDLPEAPSVEAAGGATIRPSVPTRLPAPAAPPPPAPVQPAAQTQTPPPPAPAQSVVQPPKNVGGKVQEPKLVRRVDAVYPPMARQARVSGVVRIQATIGKDGKVKKVEVLSGPPLLKQAAIDAVQKWVYSPSLLNGAPVESTTNVDVGFNLGAR